METIYLIINGIIQLVLLIVFFVLAYRVKKILRAVTSEDEFLKHILAGNTEAAKSSLYGKIYTHIKRNAKLGKSAAIIQREISSMYGEKLLMLYEEEPDFTDYMVTYFKVARK